MPISDLPDAPAPGTVVVLPFPYADRLAEKRRPALVVSSQELARRHGIVWVAMITSAENAGWEGDVEIADPFRSGLRAPSLIRPAKLATVDLARIIRRLDPIDGREFDLVRNVIAGSLG
ncbi:MAG: type II toxin-antitoxin system PemK/MazF family toxin [Hyphomicrobiales bacterium]|nr:type II toxin-antitoxin system PemK/MazF family toxin [Hyphomicrobiales bacterium]